MVNGVKAEIKTEIHILNEMIDRGEDIDEERGRGRMRGRRRKEGQKGRREDGNRSCTKAA